MLDTYGLVGDKINIDEYGSIGFGPSGISSSSFLASSFFLFCKTLLFTLIHCLKYIHMQYRVVDFVNKLEEHLNSYHY